MASENSHNRNPESFQRGESEILPTSYMSREFIIYRISVASEYEKFHSSFRFVSFESHRCTREKRNVLVILCYPVDCERNSPSLTTQWLLDEFPKNRL